ncbi:MAG: hypothetical protein P8Y10_03465 [Gemmatimonadales bacterium]|jgi:hypothetical protein
MFVSMFAIDPLAIVAIVSGLVSFAFLLAGLAFVRKRRALGATLGLLVATLLLSLAALFATFTIATQGYRALTHEEIAVLAATEPAGEQQFSARFVFPDGREETFMLAGDELYVEAYILKWKPLLNLLGFHTSYELDRVAGRYSELDEERAEPRTIYTLAAPKPFNLFDLRRRYPLLFAPFVDAEYGSATFVEVDEAAELEVRVSTTGLLIRERPESSG